MMPCGTGGKSINFILRSGIPFNAPNLILFLGEGDRYVGLSVIFKIHVAEILGGPSCEVVGLFKSGPFESGPLIVCFLM